MKTVLTLLTLFATGLAFVLFFQNRSSDALQNWQSVWTYDAGGVGQSSLVASDLNQDGVKDLLTGSGIFDFEGRESALHAIDGRTGKMLWRFKMVRDAFATPALTSINNDQVMDVVMGGRFADLYAVNGKDGELIWQLSRANPNIAIRPMNFNTAVPITDQNKDGVSDLLAVQGGAHPDGPDPVTSVAWIVSGADGKLIKKADFPDQEEIYSVPAVSSIGFVMGTGGERRGGSLHLTSFNLEPIWSKSIPEKGIIASPLVWESGEHASIFTAAFNGTLRSHDLKSGQLLWEQHFSGYETYSSPALVPEKRGALLAVQLSKGIWPAYSESILVLMSAKTGEVVGKKVFGVFSSSSPLVADFDGDGRYELIATSNLEPGFDKTTKGELALWSVPDLIKRKSFLWSGFSAATPWLGDLDNNGRMDLAYAYLGFVRRAESEDVQKGSQVSWGQFRGSAFDGVSRSASD